MNIRRGSMADRVQQRIMQFVMSQRELTNPVQSQGAQLEQALQQPVGDVAPLEGIEDAVVMKALGV